MPNDVSNDIRNLPAGTVVVSTLDAEPGRVVEPATYNRSRTKARTYVVLTADGREVWEVGDIIVPEPDPQHAALGNPRVMAAAHDLLAACKSVEALWRKHGLGDDAAESEPVLNLLRRAIARAGGRSE